MRLSFCLFLLLLAVPVLAQEQPAPDAPRWRIGDDLVGTSWRAETIRGEPVADPSTATIDFLPGDHVRGQVACNRYVGPFASRADRVTFGPLRVSRLKCGSAAPLQMTFLDMLQRASRAVLVEDRLELQPVQGPSSRFVRRTE
jgi:heat shock protein HslJ